MKGKIWFMAVLLLLGCSQQQPRDSGNRAEYQQEIERWHLKRIEELTGPKGWINVAGLFWLREGINTFGSNEANDIVFPASLNAERAGYFLLEGGVVTQQLTSDITVTRKGIPVKKAILFHPDSAGSITLEFGPLQWFVIKRDSKYGIRLRDFKNPELEKFAGINRYPVDEAYRVLAAWEKSEGRTISITNILGQTTQQPSPGSLVFSFEGVEYKLDALDEGGDELFIIFGDATNTRGTYGAGRYLYVPKSDSINEVIVDFNKAQNPPCAFTDFATCPLPPKQNVLTFEVMAGEKNFEHH